jgi:hypothetical protein
LGVWKARIVIYSCMVQTRMLEMSPVGLTNTNFLAMSRKPALIEIWSSPKEAAWPIKLALTKNIF